jgi:hypothetical protein
VRAQNQDVKIEAPAGSPHFRVEFDRDNGRFWKATGRAVSPTFLYPSYTLTVEPKGVEVAPPGVYSDAITLWVDSSLAGGLVYNISIPLQLTVRTPPPSPASPSPQDAQSSAGAPTRPGIPVFAEYSVRAQIVLYALIYLPIVIASYLLVRSL